MYEYKFIKIPFTKFTGKATEDYREVIIREATAGWRFVQLVAPDFITSGVSVGTYYELIFEKNTKSV